MTVLLVSNGHGEDVMAAAIASELQDRGVTAEAVPLVGEGRAYDVVNVPTFGPKRATPSGGYALRGLGRFASDVRAGLIPATVGAWRAVRRRSGDAAALLVVGDVYAVSVAAFYGSTPRYYLPSAVSVLAWPERTAPWEQPYGPWERRLMRRSRRVYARDGASADWLHAHGVASTRDLGNPMLDALWGDAEPDRPGPYLLLLPGTRDDRWFSLPVMLGAVAELGDLPLQPVVAWAGAEGPPSVPDWRLEVTGRSSGTVARYVPEAGSDAPSVEVVRGGFGALLRSARVALSTSGTAAEQAAGLGVPMVGFVTSGPQYTRPFATGQKRALRDALELTVPDPRAIASAARMLHGDEARRRRAREDGRTAMGLPGAASRIADDLVADLSRDPTRHASGQASGHPARDPARDPAQDSA